MNLKPLGANKTELEIGNRKILFSYQTPVAFSELTSEGKMFYRTDINYSRTTNKHINSWLPKDQAVIVEQRVIDDIVNSAEVK